VTAPPRTGDDLHKPPGHPLGSLHESMANEDSDGTENSWRPRFADFDSCLLLRDWMLRRNTQQRLWACES
jgi:hypothetical protein